MRTPWGDVATTPEGHDQCASDTNRQSLAHACRGLAAQIVVDHEVALIDIPTLCHHRDAIARRHQRVRQVHADVGPVMIPEAQTMTSFGDRWDGRGGANAYGAIPTQHGVDRRNGAVDERQVQRHAVEVERNSAQHIVRERTRFVACNRAVRVTVDGRHDLLRDRDPGRQIERNLDAVRIDGETRRLQILVEPVCRRPAGRQQHEQDRQRASGATSR
jgi:hypothetical protein